MNTTSGIITLEGYDTYLRTCHNRFAKEKKNIFYQDNAPAHKSVLAMEKLRDLHYELLEHPPYSLDLAPSDFCLFPKLKPFLAGQRFSIKRRLQL